jgi:hypothetical protein
MRRFCSPFSILFFLALGGAAVCRGDVLASSSFDVNPAPADSRLTLNGDGTLTAHFNSTLDSDKVLFPLSRPLTAAESFTVTTRFKILSAGFNANPNGLAQIAFGLCNSTTTGSDRSGAPANSGVPATNSDTFDLVSFDYFPNISSDATIASPTLAPTVYVSRTGTESGFDDIRFLWGPESALNGDGEAPLPLDTWMNSELSYDLATRRVTLALSTDAAPLLINAGGGLDGDTHTIQLALTQADQFSLNSYALMLWKDSWEWAGTSVTADVVFDSFSVTAAPEPATATLVGLVALGTLLRRPSRRR